MNRRLKGSIQMTITALIWGLTFVAQSVAMDNIGPWTFNCLRNVLGTLVLIPVILFVEKLETDKLVNKGAQDTIPATSLKRPAVLKQTLIGGCFSGIFLASASLFQQYGIIETTVGKAGFITALYIILVPFLSIFLRKKIGLNEWVSAFIAVAGFYIMSIQGKPSINRGDIILLVCALLYSMQILVIDHYVDRVNTIAMSCVQFFVSMVISSVGMFIIEHPSGEAIIAAAFPIIWAGIVSSGIAYTLQIVGQRNLEPTIASLIMSLESVFSAIAGFFILHQILSTKEIIGCILVFSAVILSQIPPETIKKIFSK